MNLYKAAPLSALCDLIGPGKRGLFAIMVPEIKHDIENMLALAPDRHSMPIMTKFFGSNIFNGIAGWTNQSCGTITADMRLDMRHSCLIVNNTGKALQFRLGLLVEVRGNFMDRVFLLTTRAFETDLTAAPVNF